MERDEKESKEVVLNYSRSLHTQKYDLPQGLSSSRIRGHCQSGESFREPGGFIGMLKAYEWKYDLKKFSSEGENICAFCEYGITSTTIFTSSWYRVEDGKSASVRDLFDSGQMPHPIRC